ncbi:hypothetical protein BTH41_04679 [Bacillus mycoides]|nr:hypothetical protein BTH41_04679 [Bacillus mycoides]
MGYDHTPLVRALQSHPTQMPNERSHAAESPISTPARK